MNLYSKIIIILSFLTSTIILIVGVVKPINGMIIGGVISLIGSTLLFMIIMIQNNSKPIQSNTTNITNTNNPLSVV
jgi:hypothetical protein